MWEFLPSIFDEFIEFCNNFNNFRFISFISFRLCSNMSILEVCVQENVDSYQQSMCFILSDRISSCLQLRETILHLWDIIWKFEERQKSLRADFPHKVCSTFHEWHDEPFQMVQLLSYFNFSELLRAELLIISLLVFDVEFKGHEAWSQQKNTKNDHILLIFLWLWQAGLSTDLKLVNEIVQQFTVSDDQVQYGNSFLLVQILHLYVIRIQKASY